ncbi:MAG TPA: hypothetical protein VGF69_16815 [Thermoanaerobaculia bacterium]|jgi:hypothetical protein
MNRSVLAVAVLLAVAGCGGDRFDLQNPPRWLKNIKSAMPSKPLLVTDVRGDCFGPRFGRCSETVLRSKKFVRSAKVRLLAGNEVRMSYRDVSVTITRDSDGELPVRREGGELIFDCVATDENGCAVVLLN